MIRTWMTRTFPNLGTSFESRGSWTLTALMEINVF